MRLKLIIEYDGTAYHGWQRQKNQLSVQQTIEDTLKKMTHTPITLIGSSRTDARVHAVGQVAHFDLPDSITITSKNLLRGLNSLLPRDISIHSVKPVSLRFHAQKNTSSKIYTYQILNAPVPSALLRNRAWWIMSPLNLKKMNQAAKLILGKHDFKAFQNQGTKLKSTVREIYTSHFRKKNTLVIYEIEGNGFLKQMVRNLVSSFVEIGKGEMSIKEFKDLVKSKDRSLCPKPALPQGLFLSEVKLDV